jgi:RIO-like serine/threonine protein kinase
MAKAQQRVMEMEQHEAKVVAKRECTILDKVTLLEKGMKIPNPKQFMWT